jgi:hypothetical protein
MLLYFNNIIFNFYNNIIENYNQFSLNFKLKYFNNKVLHFAIYNKYTEKYLDVYNYDNFFMLLYLYFLGLEQKLINVNNLYFLNNEIIIVTFIKDNLIYKLITDESAHINKLIDLNKKKISINFIYCNVYINNDIYDISHYFIDFRTSILINKKLETGCYVNALSHYYKKDIWMENNSILKLMMDNDYIEKVFKEKDKLTIIDV